jgi:uncharacterized protein YggE
MKPALCRGLIVSLYLGVLTPVASAMAAPTPNNIPFTATTISLASDGETRTAPDIAEVRLGVSSIAKTASEALAQNAEKMNSVVAALKGASLAAKDIQTSALNVNAQYTYDQNQPPRLTGYEANSQISAKVRNLDHLGSTLDATIAAGATQLEGVDFGLANPAAAEDAARERAIKRLRKKADLYAHASGYRVVRLVSLVEGPMAPSPSPAPLVRFGANMAAKASTPIEPGELKITVELTGLYELGPQ